MLPQPGTEYIFAHTMMTLSWNLMCQVGSSTIKAALPIAQAGQQHALLWLPCSSVLGGQWLVSLELTFDMRGAGDQHVGRTVSGPSQFHCSTKCSE